jgi:hypothetical protein
MSHYIYIIYNIYIYMCVCVCVCMYVCEWVHACYHSVQNLLSSCLLSKNVKVIIYKTIIKGVEENIWTKEGWSDGRVEKAA